MVAEIPIELLIQTALTGVVGWAIKSLLDQIKMYREESKEWRNSIIDKVEKLHDAVQANMRANIIYFCEKYLYRGWITTEELSSLSNLYEKYTALNDHNGFIDGYMARVNELKITEV